MQTRGATLLLVAVDPIAGSLVGEAARRAFSPMRLVTLSALDRVLEREVGRDDLLVLMDPTLEDVERAQAAKDSHGLSRWPVVVLSSKPGMHYPLVTQVPREIWSAQTLALVFQSAAAQHDLQWENERARGDLQTMARRISHDLRSPLGSVVSTGEMIKEILAEKDPQSVSFTDPLFSSVDGIVNLLERVGLVLNSTTKPVAPAPVDMTEAVGNALLRCERLFFEKKIRAQKPDKWPDVFGVEAWIEAIWWNLVRNALQHATGFTRIQLGWDEVEGGHRFWVRDDGKGIPPEKQKMLFQPFHSLHAPGAARGLGLTTVQRLVELQGGRCGYEPTAGGGSTFFFVLPAKVEKTEPAPVSEPKPASGESKPSAAVPAEPIRDPEAARLQALRASDLLDSPVEEAYDRITTLVSRVLHVPVALVSLVDESRQFFKSSCGLPEPFASKRETPLSFSFCKHVVAGNAPLQVDDATRHPLVRGNPAIEQLKVAAYLGVPLRTREGLALGALCAIDTQPRAWGPDDIATLTDLAGFVMKEVETRQVLRDQVRREAADHQLVQDTQRSHDARLAMVAELIPAGVYACDQDGHIFFYNRRAAELWGYEPNKDGDVTRYCACHKVFLPDGTFVPPDRTPMAVAVREGKTFRNVEAIVERPDGGRFTASVSIDPLRNAAGELVGAINVFEDITERKRVRQTSEFLDQLTQKVALLDGESEIKRATVEAVGRYLGLHRCLFAEWAEADGLALVTKDWSADDAQSLVGKHDLNAYGPPQWWLVLSVGNVSMDDLETEELAKAHLPSYQAIGVRSYATARLKLEGGRIAALVGTGKQPRVWRADELALMEDVISRVWPMVEKARSEAQSRQNDERLRLALDAAKLGGWVWDPATDLLIMTERGAEIFGVPPNVPVSRETMRDMLHPEDKKLAELANELAITRHSEYEMEYRARRTTGEWIWVAAKGRGVYDAEGNLVRMLGVVQDITSRKLGNEALQKQNERLRLLSDAMAQLMGAKNPKQIVRELLPKVAAHLNTDTYFNFLVAPEGGMTLNACGGVSDEAARSIQHLNFGEAICGTVALTHQPIHAMDIQHSTYDKANLVRGMGIQAYACHPFLVEGKFLGTLSFASRNRPRFDDDEVDFMRTISQYVALAIDRARSEQELAEQSRSLRIINRVGSTVAAELDLARLVQGVTDAGREVSGAEFGAFFYNVVSDKGEAYMLYTLSGAPREAFDKFGYPRNTPLFAQTFSGQGAVRIDDVLKDPRYGKMPPHHGMPKGHLPVRSYLAVPVKSRSGEVLGGLFFGHPQPGVFTEQTETIIAGIAAQAAIAIDNARLYSTLQANERQLQFITDHAPVHLALVGRDCIYRFANRAYVARFGRPMNEIIGRHISEVIGPEAWETARHHIDQVLAGHEVTYELEMQVGDLGSRWMNVIYVPERNASNEVVGFVAVSSDITSSKLAEKEADRARDKVLAASRAKDDFLAALSHELRTPLNPVLLLASEAAEDNKLPVEVRAEFAMIRKNVELEARLIDDLLDLTRITRGKLFLDLRPVDVHLVLKDALAAVKAPLETKRIVLDLHCEAEPHAVLGDSVRLQQVFWNVLNNAVKFTPAHGSVRVATSVIPGTSTIVITISDSGVGMTPQELGDIFTAFSQGEHAEDGGPHRFGGLGLGLAISRMLVEQHAGRIRAESAGRDQGSSFIIELPQLDVTAIDWEASSPESEDADIPESPLNSDKPTRVLLVEDHEATRAAIGILLQRRQFTVTGAGSLAEALELARSERFDLLISDIGLPDGNGYDLMVELQKNHDLAGIALTGYGMENDIARSREAGFSAHLVKPVSVQALEKAIAAAIG